MMIPFSYVGVVVKRVGNEEGGSGLVQLRRCDIVSYTDDVPIQQRARHGQAGVERIRVDLGSSFPSFL